MRIMRTIRRPGSVGCWRSGPTFVASGFVVTALCGSAWACAALADTQHATGGSPAYPITRLLPGWILVLPGSTGGAAVHYDPLATVGGAPGPSALRSGGAFPAGAGTSPAARARALPSVATARTSRGTASDSAFGVGRLAPELWIGTALFGILIAAGVAIARRQRPAAIDGPSQPPGEPASDSPPLAAPSLPKRRPGQQMPPERGNEALAAAAGLSGKEAASLTEDDPQPPDYMLPGSPGTEDELPHPEPGLSRVALRMLGAQRRSPWRTSAEMRYERFQVLLGSDAIEVVLASGPARQIGKPSGDPSARVRAPDLVWAPRPADTPQGGGAFTCLGAGDEGCLFIDLAAAPGAVAIGGDAAAAARLAESIVQQLCAAGQAGRSCILTVVGRAIAEPHPPGTSWVLTHADLGTADTGHSDVMTEIVISELRSDEDAFSLGRYVRTAPRRVVPVVLADLPDAPWSFSARPSPQPAAPGVA
jgi:hypothetical protein